MDSGNAFLHEAYGWTLFRQGRSKEALSKLEAVEAMGEEAWSESYLDQDRLWSHLAEVCDTLRL